MFEIHVVEVTSERNFLLYITSILDGNVRQEVLHDSKACCPSKTCRRFYLEIYHVLSYILTIFVVIHMNQMSKLIFFPLRFIPIVLYLDYTFILLVSY